MNKQKHCKCEQLLSKKISDEQWRTSWGGTPSVIVRKSTFWYDSIHGRTKKMPRKKGGFGMIGRWSDDEADRSASSMMACSNNGSGQQIQVKRVNARVNLVNVFVKHLLCRCPQSTLIERNVSWKIHYKFLPTKTKITCYRWRNINMVRNLYEGNLIFVKFQMLFLASKQLKRPL